jgi:hypothetical protein
VNTLPLAAGYKQLLWCADLDRQVAKFAIATNSVLTPFIAAPQNASSVWVRVVDEVYCAVCK